MVFDKARRYDLVTIQKDNYTASPEEAEFVGLTAVVGTIQLYR